MSKVSTRKSTLSQLPIKSGPSLRGKDLSNFMEMRKKKRTREFMRLENINKSIGDHDLTKQIDDFGRQSNLMTKNVNKNLDKQKNSIYERLKQRRQR